MTTPRPDQRPVSAGRPPPGSMSGSGDIAAALGYPGVPPAVPNCQSASAIEQPPSQLTLVTFTGAARVWSLALSFAITTGGGFPGPITPVHATVRTALGNVLLGVVQLSAGSPSQSFNGQCDVTLNGLPLVQGDSLILYVNNNTPVTGMVMAASVTVLYSMP